jgi:iron-sulfur cluster assembly accessory protein
VITFTELAIKKTKEIAASESLPLIIRVKLQGGGCASFIQDMHFEEIIGELDDVIDQDGIKIVVDPISHMYLEGTTIDYLDGPFNSGFKFLTPGVKSSCGCGKSVAF